MSGLGALKAGLWSLRLRTNGGVLQKRDRLARWAELDGAAVRQLQSERLEELLSWAQEHVPYYRDLLRRYGVVEKGQLKPDRFAELPLLDKDIIRRQRDALHAEDLKRHDYVVNTSGGSTGEPVSVLQDGQYQEWKAALKIVFASWAGYRPGARTAYVWGAPRDLQAADRLRSRIGGWLRNEIMLDAFHMPEGRMREHIERLRAFRPRLIVAYAQSIYELAAFADRSGMEVQRPHGIITSATTLHDDMRRTIERVFDAPVFNRYGSREVGDIACERKPGSSLWIAAPTHFVEVLRADGSPTEPGEPGEVVVTLLTNRIMPLIRYRIGDVATRAEVDPATRGWPRLASVRGRVTSVFPTVAGGLVDGEYFTHLFYHRPWVRRFQVVQEEVDHVAMYVIPAVDANEVPKDELTDLEVKVREVMGEDCHVKIAFVDQFDVSPTGKHHYTISKVSPFAGTAREA